jgi:DNA-binding transcriptional ArsR family regulator
VCYYILNIEYNSLNMSNLIRNNYEQTATLLRIISHPIRLAILDILLNNEEECVCHMEAILGFRQSYLSQHLMALREVGIVTDRREGRNIFYSICDKRFDGLIKYSKDLSGQKEISPLKVNDCSCPKCRGLNETFINVK